MVLTGIGELPFYENCFNFHMFRGPDKAAYMRICNLQLLPRNPQTIQDKNKTVEQHRSLRVQK